MCNSWRYKGRVALVQINDCCNKICVHSSSPHHVGNKHWDVCISFFLLHLLNIPLPGSLVVLSGDNVITRLGCFLWEVNMEIPIYSSELPSCFVSLISKIKLISHY